MTDPACGLCNDRQKYPDGVVIRGCPVHDQPWQVSEWPVRIGGLMRCCTETLRVSAEWANEGQVIECLYCSDSMRLRDGAWEWNRDHDWLSEPLQSREKVPDA